MGDEQEFLTAARAGDEDAFAALVAPHRAAVRAHCYRMLGALPDAEDALQETLLRAWRGLGGFEGRSSVRSWLHAIATNASLRLLERRPRRVLPTDLAPGDPSSGGEGPVWLEPYPDADLPAGTEGPDARYEQRESVELAFAAALQHLPARQRAVLILRDVLGFSARETAEVLDTTPTSVDSTMQRARATVRARVPERSQQATLRRGDVAVRGIVEEFATAWENHDVDAIVALLSAQARLAMPPEPGWFAGRDAIAGFLRDRPLAPGNDFRLVPTSAGAQPALAAYVWQARTGRHEPESLVVLTLDTLDDEAISQVTAFRDPALFARFGLAASLPAVRGRGGAPRR